MTPERKQYLYNQYVLSIINDGSLHPKLSRCVDTCDARLFSGHIKQACWPLASSLGDTLPDLKGRAYINREVWVYLGGSPRDLLANMPSTNLLHPHLAKLVESAIRQTQPEPEPEPTPAEEATVNNTNPTVAFETRHYVYGMDVANMTEGQLIDAIKRIEAEIADLKAVKAKSEHIKKRVAELEAMLAKVVEVLDGK